VKSGLTVSVIAAELLKVRKRWLAYLLLFVLIAGAAIQIWLGGYVAWRTEAEVEPENLRLALRTFVLPWSLVSLLDSGQFWGSFIVGVLTASMVATEYGWGTVRQALIRGQTRSQYLTVKLLGITILSSAILLTALAVGIAFSLIATVIAGEAVYATTNAPEGRVYALSASDGTVRWSWAPSPPDYILGSPAIAGGRLYVAVDSGYLYALETPEPPIPLGPGVLLAVAVLLIVIVAVFAYVRRRPRD